MRMIKTFEAYIDKSFDLEDVIMKYYNRKLVDDACDMALDDLDTGLKLNITITDFRNNELLYIDYCHKFMEINYESYRGDPNSQIEEVIRNIESNPLKYRILLIIRNLDGSIKRAMEPTKELIDRLRDAYPDELIIR